ncbi:hypothetical protein CV093_06295 [Oceanobacillus sp. 143]|nr:hypothetical protein CV093_06295 [Oceanobacillus sp. 143]
MKEEKFIKLIMEKTLDCQPDCLSFALSRKSRDALFFPGLSNVADGPVIGDGTGLFRTTATGGKVFWLDKEDGVTTFKRWITSPEAMDRYHFTWDRIPTLPGNFADIPDGSPISV